MRTGINQPTAQNHMENIDGQRVVMTLHKGVRHKISDSASKNVNHMFEFEFWEYLVSIRSHYLIMTDNL